MTYRVRLQDAATNKNVILKISLIRSGPKVKRILLVARCTSTTEYPPPKFILTGEVSPGPYHDRVTIYERTNGAENAVEVRKDHRAGSCMACG